jgi:hypothetical protein
VIADEIHQYFLPYYHSRSIWGVTATPFEKMSSIFNKFGHNNKGLQLLAKWNYLSSWNQNTNVNLDVFAEAMNVFMIR